MTGLLAKAAARSTQAATEAAAAADTVWRLESSWSYAPWLTVVAVTAFVLLVGYCYAKELSPAGREYRIALAALRLTTLALLMAMLSEFLLAGSRSGRPRFAVLLDTSASMGVVDPIEDLPAPIQEGLGDKPIASTTRLDLGRAALTAGGTQLLDRLAAEYDVELYRVAEQLNRLEASAPDGTGSSQSPEAEPLSAIAVDASAPGTRLGDAVEQLVANPGVAPLQGVLIVTDGQVTAGRPLSAAAESARRAGAPLYWLGLGAAEPPPDIALADLLAEEVVFVDDLVSFRATLRTTPSVTTPVRVTLRREGDPAVLAEQTIPPPAGGGATPVTLIHRPEKPGDYRYTLAAEPVDGERNVENNRASHSLSVRDQQVRVLLAAGTPSYEFRYLKHLLERDSTVELDSFLQEADLEYAPADPSAVARLPLRQSELGEYDAVVILDLDPRLVPRSFWASLRRFVGEEGGGLALVAGPRSLPGAYRGLDDFVALCPTKITDEAIGETVTGAGFRVLPTPVGARRAALQLAGNVQGTMLAWRRLPELYWYAELGEPKPAAQVLATHPSASAAGGGAAPLIVSHYFGAGQVVLHAVDATYRWRRRTGDVYFARYWVQTLRSLARGRLAAGGRGAELTVDRTRYEPGEPIRLRLRADKAASASGVGVLVEPDSGPQQRVTLTPVGDERGVFEATLDRLPIGRYRALVADTALGGGEPVAAEFEVAAPPGEFARLEMAADAMRAAAERSRGGFFTLDQFEELASALPRARRVPLESLPPSELWNRWWMLAAVVGCLSTEWILRKRKAML